MLETIKILSIFKELKKLILFNYLGILYTMPCAPGTAFNPAIGVCDWPENVPGCGAQDKPPKDPNPPKNPSPPSNNS